jgi:DNA-binding NarL/FixJ family response regulator
VAEGYANKQIADVLQVSIKTVEKHRQSVMHKLNIHEAASLTRYALAAGIVEQTPGPQVLQAN